MTVSIEDHLLRRAKELAARTGRMLDDVIDDALRVALIERAPRPTDRVVLPTDGGSGLQPGVDLEGKEALAALLDASEPHPDAAG